MVAEVWVPFLQKTTTEKRPERNTFVFAPPRHSFKVPANISSRPPPPPLTLILRSLWINVCEYGLIRVVMNLNCMLHPQLPRALFWICRYLVRWIWRPICVSCSYWHAVYLPFILKFSIVKNLRVNPWTATVIPVVLLFVSPISVEWDYYQISDRFYEECSWK
jgi:hypothetical protein